MFLKEAPQFKLSVEFIEFLERFVPPFIFFSLFEVFI